MHQLEDFFRKPDKSMVRLSPSGRYLAYMQPHERRLNVFVRDLETGEVTRATSVTDRDLAGYAWANDERLVYLRDSGGDENYHLYAVSRDGSGPLDLTPFEGVKCSIVDQLEEVDEEILFQMNRRNPELFDVYRLDVNTGEMKLLGENPGNIQQWITDHDSRLRLATTTDGVNTSILFRDEETDPWRTVASYNFKEGASPLMFTFDNEGLYVASNIGRDKAAVYEYDLRRGEPTKLIFEHPEVDVSGVLKSRVDRKLIAVAYTTDRAGYRFLDEEWLRVQRFLDERLAGYEYHLTSHSRDEKRFIVYSASDRTRGSYHLLDREKMELTKLFDLSPWLDENELAPMKPVSYAARDGLTVHGYLTLPPGREPADLPLVVNPHGGPWHRDVWGFNPEVQFLASRGYAVLQMNFRSSTGYGRRFMEAGFGKWGLEMQADISDGVRWAVEQGVADPARVAIYGGSYGGYAALAGLTFTPELYACGVSYVGVSSLFTWIASIPPYWKPYLEMMYEMVGHPERDKDRFVATSPLHHADRIRAPLLVAQGANDPRVRKEESDQIVEALKKRGVPVEYMVKDNEGHGFRNEENIFEFYRALERFLGEHLERGGS